MKALVTGTALKDATARDYRRAFERAGQHIEPAALERLAVADLDLADNFEHDSTPRTKPARDTATERKTLEQEAQASGATIVTGQMIKREIASLHAKPIPGSKWSYAMGRLARILARPNLPSRKPWEDCEIPHLAKRVYELKAFVTFRHLEKVGDQANPFFGLSARDFERKFRAMTMQICDESTGRLGTWWTPR